MTSGAGAAPLSGALCACPDTPKGSPMATPSPRRRVVGSREKTRLENLNWDIETEPSSKEMGGAANKHRFRVMDGARETDALIVKRSIEHAVRTGTEALNWL